MIFKFSSINQNTSRALMFIEHEKFSNKTIYHSSAPPSPAWPPSSRTTAGWT